MHVQYVLINVIIKTKLNFIIALDIMLINGAMKCIKLKHINLKLIVLINANVKND